MLMIGVDLIAIAGKELIDHLGFEGGEKYLHVGKCRIRRKHMSFGLWWEVVDDNSSLCYTFVMQIQKTNCMTY